MEKSQIINLINQAVTAGPSVWADLGSGEGAFTLALRELGGTNIQIFSIDKSSRSLRKQSEEFKKQFPQTKIEFIKSDFTKQLTLIPLDGILMANSLHFIQNKADFLSRIKNNLKPEGRILIVEYDTDKGNFFVPYPLSFPNLSKLLTDSGFGNPQLLTTVPSRYQNGIYSALATKQ
ncbi:MAG TPA: methyltransferase domain-containing protein [Verrucomicrobiae bacterium]|nr:methyltransferase domain-containing protein [Verrucomicrobiae bacterium]